MESKLVVPGQYITPTYKLTQEKKNKPVKYVAGSGTAVNAIEVVDGDGSTKTLPVICATILGKTHFVKVSAGNSSNGESNNDNDANSDEENAKDEVEKELAYIVYVVPKNQQLQSNEHNNKATHASNVTNKVSSSINLPQENDIVLVRITRISQKQANCEIISLESKSSSQQPGQSQIGGNILTDSGTGSNGATALASIPAGGGSQHNHNQQAIASSITTPTQATIYDLGENYRGIIRASDIRSTERDRVVVGQCFKPGDIVRCMVISLGDGQNYYLSTARNDLGVVLAKSYGGAGTLMYPVDWQNMIDLDSGVVEMRKNANPFII
ncbi:CSL4 [Candida margitis]|uniref:CSL4 n=1 Tax=Candida margitis TaxID=1775924 RepID=UPI0022275DA8|nr:CSL4 [Candida margitis]KAI5969481.1 CSL4 [Candida margitis]